MKPLSLWNSNSIMRATRRRMRHMDPLTSPDAVRVICYQLREQLPDLTLKSEKELLRFLYAVHHIERRPATDSQRGRPGYRRCEDLLKAVGALRSLLKPGADFTLQFHRAVSSCASLPY